MKFREVGRRVDVALENVYRDDRYLLENDLSERCIASRIAMYLQTLFPDYHVDVEYNRVGMSPKRLNLPEICANYRNADGSALVVPDVIVHQRGERGPNLLVLELKKTSNPLGVDCDRQRILAFRKQLGYDYGAIIECETRRGHEAGIRIVDWL